MKTMLRNLVAGIVLAGAMVPVMPGTARAQDGFSIEIADTATRLHKTLIVVTVTYTCPEDAEFPSIFLVLRQSSGGEVTGGISGADAECTGAPVTQELSVVADPGARPFNLSSALVAASISGCIGDECFGDSDTEIVDVRRR